MALPAGTYPIGGAFIQTAALRPPATPELRDAGVLLPEGGKWLKVNDAGDDWEDAGGGLPADYPATFDMVRREMVRAILRPQTVIVRDVYWYIAASGDPADMTEALFLAGTAGRSDTFGPITVTQNTERLAFWHPADVDLYGAAVAQGLTGPPTAWTFQPAATALSFDGPHDITIGGNDGHAYLGRLGLTPFLTWYGALMFDPGAA